MTDPIIGIDESEVGRMVAAIAYGEMADHLFDSACWSIGISSEAALKAPLLSVGIASLRTQGNA